EPWTPDMLVMRLVFLLFLPAALVFWFRVRTRRPGDATAIGIVWLNWVLLGIWLYWISVIRLEDLGGFVAALDTDFWVISWFLGVLLFCGLPLAAGALCVWIIAPELHAGEADPGRVWKIVRLNLAGQASSMAPIGMFMMGTALVSQEIRAGFFSVLLAYATYRALGWYTWRASQHNAVELPAGALRERA